MAVDSTLLVTMAGITRTALQTEPLKMDLEVVAVVTRIGIEKLVDQVSYLSIGKCVCLAVQSVSSEENPPRP